MMTFVKIMIYQVCKNRILPNDLPIRYLSRAAHRSMSKLVDRMMKSVSRCIISFEKYQVCDENILPYPVFRKLPDDTLYTGYIPHHSCVRLFPA